MKFHFLQHVPFEGPAFIQTYSHDNSVSLEGTALYKGEPLPRPEDFDLLFIMGGPMGIGDTEIHPWMQEEKKFIELCIKKGKNIIGICLGAQMIADVLGAPVTRNKHKEIGWFPVRKLPAPKNKISPLLQDTFHALHWHGETFGIPAGALHLAESEACSNQAFLYEDRVLGLQFHLESTEYSVKDLLLNCADEIIEDSWIQKPKEILNTAHMPDSNNLMKAIIEEITGPDN